MSDLPIEPCYNTSNCEKYNCGTSGSTLDEKCISKQLNNDGNIVNVTTFRNKQWGKDPDFCDGILRDCPDSDTNCLGFNLQPIKNTNGKFMGCPISETNDTIPNSEISICSDFLRNNDKIANECQNNCWSIGGYKIADQQCSENFKEEKDCNNMPYYCKWDKSKNICKSVGETSDPFINYKTNMKTKLSLLPTSQTFIIKNKCSSNEVNCLENPLLEDTDDFKLITSQSLWDSRKQTSYNPRDRIFCLINKNTDSKVCMATPRCQYVDTTCECGLKNGIFMCSKINVQDSQTDSSGNTVLNRLNGYCTWCKNQSKPVSEQLVDKEFITRQPIEWGTVSNCSNRCSNYNECEVVKFKDPIDGVEKSSEEMWNNCIWNTSNKKFGVDPEVVVSLNNNEKKQILSKNGFCFDKDNKEHTNLVKECEKKLEFMASINGKPVINNPGFNSTTSNCVYKYNWFHNCQKSSINGANVIDFSENYLCTWCPSLQCKIGNSKDICSTIDSSGTCTTGSSNGDIVNNEFNTWDKDCGCSKTEQPVENIKSNKLLPILAGIGLSILVTIIIILIIVL